MDKFMSFDVNRSFVALHGSMGQIKTMEEIRGLFGIGDDLYMDGDDLVFIDETIISGVIDPENVWTIGQVLDVVDSVVHTGVVPDSVEGRS